MAIQFPNRNVQALREAPWADVLGLLGQNGEEIMIHLLLDCGIFVPLDASKGIFYQLSGMVGQAMHCPLTDLYYRTPAVESTEN